MKVKYIGESDSMRFVYGKVYTVLGKEGPFWRVIDETGEDYLYTLQNFQIVDETEYLRSSEKNYKRLLQSIREIDSK
ncbi:hypothetical protein EV210_12310 [Anaerospora hongkongensis]|uniref:Uncharacterized protein n=1 Tax=Anaerospora hongkongensis TaxID=244830 RepID=A0A4R1PP93_9FIRM|nr:hypothetical protein [Anaerospora hongkongensis]TCL32190.1 hypothetical protein EV210_12310 [Anaerospora hongkongensis]